MMGEKTRSLCICTFIDLKHIYYVILVCTVPFEWINISKYWFEMLAEGYALLCSALVNDWKDGLRENIWYPFVLLVVPHRAVPFKHLVGVEWTRVWLLTTGFWICHHKPPSVPELSIFRIPHPQLQITFHPHPFEWQNPCCGMAACFVSWCSKHAVP